MPSACGVASPLGRFIPGFIPSFLFIPSIFTYRVFLHTEFFAHTEFFLVPSFFSRAELCFAESLFVRGENVLRELFIFPCTKYPGMY
jgi:hypothetical protein